MSATEVFTIIASMLGGLALFLFGMSTMSDSLSSMTGGALDRIIGIITKNKWLAFAFGTLMTAVVQSSSAITVLAVGLVNSGIIALTKAIGLVIGANLGTTATAWLLSLNAIDGESLLLTIIKPSSFSPFLAIIGVAMMMFTRSDTKKKIGSALLGFAVMMIGMNLMSQAVAPLREVPALQKMLVGFSNPVWGFLFAAAFTMLIQSSDATVGIIQAFALSMGITYGMAIPLVCGAQLGTCITSILSSVGTSNNGKRTALLNLYYNLFKTVPFMLIFYALNHVLQFSVLEKSVGGIGIPLFHTLINLLGAAVWLPLSNVIVSLAEKTIPFSAEEKEEQANVLTILDPILLSSPRFALEQADKAVQMLAETAEEAFATVRTFDAEKGFEESVRVLCRRIERYRDQIEKYLTDITMNSMEPELASRVSLLTNANTAFGSIGPLVLRILDFYHEIVSSKNRLPESDRTESRVLGSAINEIITVTVTGFELKSATLYETIQLYREEIMEMGDQIKKRRIVRMHEEIGRMSMSTLFTDICYTEEQLIDYCDMVADALIKYSRQEGKEETLSKEMLDKKRQQIKALFRDKYSMLNLEED